MALNFKCWFKDVNHSSSMEMALQNDLVLQVLSNNLTHDDLKSSRQVCWKWNLYMTPVIIGSSAVTLNTINGMRKFTTEMPVDGIPSYVKICIPSSQHYPILPSNFTGVFEKFSGQIRNLKILFHLNAGKDENLMEWLQLLANLRHLVELDLSVEFYHRLSINNINVNAVPVMDSLEKLQIQMVLKTGTNSPDWALEGQFLLKFSEIIIKLAPKVKSVSFNDILFYNANCHELFHRKYFSILGDVDRGILLPKLKDLRLKTIRGSIRYILKVPTLLTHLTLIWASICPPDEQFLDWQSLAEVLAKHSPSLETFKMSVTPKLLENPPVINIGLQFPEVMPQLTSLQLQLLPPVTLGDFVWGRIHFPIEEVDYAKRFPKIQEMTLDTANLYRSTVNTVMLSPIMPVCESLRKLAITDPSKTLAEKFPNAVIERIEPLQRRF